MMGTTKATPGRAAALVEEARTIMAFITGEADATGPDEPAAALPDQPAET